MGLVVPNRLLMRTEEVRFSNNLLSVFEGPDNGVELHPKWKPGNDRPGDWGGANNPELRKRLLLGRVPNKLPTGGKVQMMPEAVRLPAALS